MAESKRLWKGHKGLYKKLDMAKWIKNFDETKLSEFKSKFAKHIRSENDDFDLKFLKSKGGN